MQLASLTGDNCMDVVDDGEFFNSELSMGEEAVEERGEGGTEPRGEASLDFSRSDLEKSSNMSDFGTNVKELEKSTLFG